MKRKTLWSLLIIVLVLPLLAGCSGNTSGNGAKTSASTTTTPLLFPKNDYTVETKTVTTSAGDKKVTYHLHKDITYVAKPVDAFYESMNVNVPVNIDGVDIDTTNAPILFNVNVGGYMSSSVTDSPPGGGNPPGGTPPGGAFPSGAPNGGAPNGGAPGSQLSDLALAAGYVVVDPGCRGSDNKAADGTYYGKDHSDINFFAY